MMLHLFSKCLLSTFCEPSTVVSTVDSSELGIVPALLAAGKQTINI